MLNVLVEPVKSLPEQQLIFLHNFIKEKLEDSSVLNIKNLDEFIELQDKIINDFIKFKPAQQPIVKQEDILTKFAIQHHGPEYVNCNNEINSFFYNDQDSEDNKKIINPAYTIIYLTKNLELVLPFLINFNDTIRINTRSYDLFPLLTPTLIKSSFDMMDWLFNVSPVIYDGRPIIIHDSFRLIGKVYTSLFTDELKDFTNKVPAYNIKLNKLLLPLLKTKKQFNIQDIFQQNKINNIYNFILNNAMKEPEIKSIFGSIQFDDIYIQTVTANILITDKNLVNFVNIHDNFHEIETKIINNEIFKKFTHFALAYGYINSPHQHITTTEDYINIVDDVSNMATTKVLNVIEKTDDFIFQNLYKPNVNISLNDEIDNTDLQDSEKEFLKKMEYLFTNRQFNIKEDYIQNLFDIVDIFAAYEYFKRSGAINTFKDIIDEIDNAQLKEQVSETKYNYLQKLKTQLQDILDIKDLDTVLNTLKQDLFNYYISEEFFEPFRIMLKNYDNALLSAIGLGDLIPLWYKNFNTSYIEDILNSPNLQNKIINVRFLVFFISYIHVFHKNDQLNNADLQTEILNNVKKLWTIYLQLKLNLTENNNNKLDFILFTYPGIIVDNKTSVEYVEQGSNRILYINRSRLALFGIKDCTRPNSYLVRSWIGGTLNSEFHNRGLINILSDALNNVDVHKMTVIDPDNQDPIIKSINYTEAIRNLAYYNEDAYFCYGLTFSQKLSIPDGLETMLGFNGDLSTLSSVRSQQGVYYKFSINPNQPTNLFIINQFVKNNIKSIDDLLKDFENMNKAERYADNILVPTPIIDVIKKPAFYLQESVIANNNTWLNFMYLDAIFSLKFKFFMIQAASAVTDTVAFPNYIINPATYKYLSLLTANPIQLIKKLVPDKFEQWSAEAEEYERRKITLTTQVGNIFGAIIKDMYDNVTVKDVYITTKFVRQFIYGIFNNVDDNSVTTKVFKSFNDPKTLQAFIKYQLSDSFNSKITTELYKYEIATMHQLKPYTLHV